LGVNTKIKRGGEKKDTMGYPQRNPSKGGAATLKGAKVQRGSRFREYLSTNEIKGRREGLRI